MFYKIYYFEMYFYSKIFLSYFRYVLYLYWICTRRQRQSQIELEVGTPAHACLPMRFCQKASKKLLIRNIPGYVLNRCQKAGKILFICKITGYVQIRGGFKCSMILCFNYTPYILSPFIKSESQSEPLNIIFLIKYT